MPVPAGRPTKKLKRPRLVHDDQTTLASARASLTSLPIEILAEILLYTCSPPTVLAVSRTCSFLYHSLFQNPAASFIWRGVRKTCVPFALPDPGHSWKKTEADYAAFVFGGGVCEVCGKITRAMYVSFAARIRLCGSWYCRRKMLDEYLINVSTKFQGRDRQSLWAPYVESNLCFYPSTFHGSTWPDNDSVLLRKTDWEKFEHDLLGYRIAEEIRAGRSPPATTREGDERRERFMERCHAGIQRFPAIMELSGRLISWKWIYDREYKRIKKENRTWTKNLAELEGWDLADLVASQTYGSLQRRKTLLLESIGPDDVPPIRSAIESELLALQARHKRQKAEAAYKEKLTEVKKIYARMECGALEGSHTDVASPSDPTSTSILPPLSIFCTLPSVRALKGSPDPSVVPPNSTSSTSDIKSSPLATSLIMSDIHTWLIPVQKCLMGLLGYPNGWQSASTLTLHPLKRVTARFFCRQCGEGKVGKGNRRERCLDFKGVCSHVCVAAQRKIVEGQRQEVPQEGEVEATDSGDRNRQDKDKGKGKGKKKSGVKTVDWKMEVFEKDERAIRLIKTILDLTGFSEENSSTASELNAKGGIIRCMTCKGWIVMDFDSAIGHAHRHEFMQIQLLLTSAPSHVMFMKKDVSAPDGNTRRTIPNSRFAFERGTSELLLRPTHRSRNLCKKVNYGCKHCFLVLERNVVVGMEKPGVGANGKGARAMNFNGLRSHVKEKHGIQDIRDEDFFCYSPIETDGGRGQFTCNASDL